MALFSKYKNTDSPEPQNTPAIHSGESRTSDMLGFIFVWIPYALLVRRFWWLCDDAFISFRYSRNWALGNGLRYNLGEHIPVEGYSNFLWVAIIKTAQVLHIVG